jgi:hypothetical protein
VIWKTSVRFVGLTPLLKATAARARWVPKPRREQLIVNVKRPLSSGANTVLTFLPSTKNATDSICVPLT